MHVRYWLLVSSLLLACGTTGVVGDAGPEDQGAPPVDADGDFISDIDEDAPGRDTDSDGDPDYLDLDADDDGIPDAVEAGDEDLATAPVDSDRDGTPDYLDLDSDDNGRPDAAEGADDPDGDGVPNHADRDDDGDLIADAVELGDPAAPRDSDGDGVPDFRDLDSDGDTILDRTEWASIDAGLDSDGDGTVDALDLDSDNDGWLDAEEAGDDDLSTPPVDSDGDRIPDYLDVDSDGDGLTDAEERDLGTDRARADGDGDGESDPLELRLGTDPNDGEDSTAGRGGLVVEVPYRENPEPRDATLRFATDVTRLDAYVLLDNTASMAAEASDLRGRLGSAIDGVRCARTEVSCDGDAACAAREVCGPEGLCMADPAVDGCVPDVFAGLGTFGSGVDTYRHLQRPASDLAVTQLAVPTETVDDGAEALFQSLACLIDPTACLGGVCVDPGDGVGCPGFRPDALRVVVLIADAPDACPTDGDGACDPDDANRATRGLRLSSTRVLSIDADSDAPVDDLRSVASVGVDERSFYRDTDLPSVTLIDAITDGLRQVANEAPLFVDIEADDLPDDDGDGLQFIQRLEVDMTSAGCGDPGAVSDTNSDGFEDAYPFVRPGLPLCWRLLGRLNARVDPLCTPQVFRVALTVFGDGVPLDRRDVVFVVPADPSCP